MDTGGDDKEAAERQQLSICLETKMPSDVVAAVLATKSAGGDDDAAAGKVRKVERAESNVENKNEEETAEEEEEEEQRDVVDESLTISMLVDEDRESDASPNDDTKAVEKDEEEETQSATIASAKVHADDSARIEDWIATVQRQNRQRTSSVVYYDETMPSLDDLLAAREGWSQEFVEEALTTTSSGSRGRSTTIDPDLDLSFEEYAEVICALLGVPIYKGSNGTTSSRSLIQSLHLAMSLMLEADDEMVQDDIF